MAASTVTMPFSQPPPQSVRPCLGVRGPRPPSDGLAGASKAPLFGRLSSRAPEPSAWANRSRRSPLGSGSFDCPTDFPFISVFRFRGMSGSLRLRGASEPASDRANPEAFHGQKLKIPLKILTKP